MGNDPMKEVREFGKHLEWEAVIYRMKANPAPCGDDRKLIYRWDDWLTPGIPMWGWCEVHRHRRSDCNRYLEMM